MLALAGCIWLACQGYHAVLDQVFSGLGGGGDQTLTDEEVRRSADAIAEELRDELRRSSNVSAGELA